MKFGIDFGTTNTAVSIMQVDVPQELSFGSTGVSQNYVPSVFAIKSGKLNREYHGMEAKAKIGESADDYIVYQNFKMLLGEPKAVIKEHWGSQPLTPEEVTQKYIERLVKQITIDHQLTPESVVVTVPEVWINQGLLSKREHLIKIFKKLGIFNVRVESEPIAAASYYLHRYQAKKGHPFQGYLLVCDCGGGTMDFCLVRVQQSTNNQPRMTVLERAGNGKVNNHLGSAGVAFDQAVVDQIFPDLKKKDPVEFYRCVREFETNKITQTDEVSELLKMYRFDSALTEGDHLFLVAKKPVYPNILTRIFDKLIAPNIRLALEQIMERAKAHHINNNDPDSFRVLMVGGFSSFYLVQEVITQYFGSKMESDKRFENILTLQDRSLAISKGAALIANNLTEVIHTCPANIGIRVVTDKGPRHRLVLSKGMTVGECQYPIYYRQLLRVIDKNDAIKFYLEFNPDQQPEIVSLPGQTISSIFPLMNEKDNIRIGFSMDENMIFFFHVYIDGKPSEVKIIPLGNLMLKYT